MANLRSSAWEWTPSLQSSEDKCILSGSTFTYIFKDKELDVSMIENFPDKGLAG